MEELYDRVGPERAHELLAERDPEAASAIHPNDRRRIVRALELVEAGSSLRRGADRLWASDTRHPTLLVGLDVPREELDRRIDERTAAMWERGVEDEVAEALSQPVVATAATIFGLREVAGAAARTRRARRSRPDAQIRCISAEMDAADPGPRYRSRRPPAGRHRG